MEKMFNIFVIIGTILLIIFGVCYVEILMKNLTENPQYSDWNILVNLIEYANNKHFN